MKFRFAILMMLAIVTGLSAAAQTPTPVKLTLKEAEDLAIKAHPQIKAALLIAQAAGQVPTEMGAARFPTLEANISGAGASQDSRIAAGGLNNPLILSRGAMGLEVSQLILDFGRTGNLVASSRLRALSANQDTEATREQVLLQVDSAYFTAQRNQALLKVAEQTVAARQVVVEQVEALARNGVRSGLDVSIANYNLAEAKLLLSRSQNDLRAAFAELSAALGNHDDQTYDLADEPLPVLQIPGQTEMVNEALNLRPELRSLQFERDAAYRFVKAEKALKLPSVGALWNVGWVPLGFSNQQLPNHYNAAGFTINIPIFNGRLFKAREAEAEYKARAVEENLKDFENRVARDVRVAWLNVYTAYERIGLSAQLQSRANEALDLAQERYRLGLSSIVELSQAQLNMTIADIESANAKYDYLLQRAVLNYQTGQLH
ncbi:MAG: TolC family protein [Blastocatellia bacterium]|nr:TolC family protein [Blastocatellia bacterium]